MSTLTLFFVLSVTFVLTYAQSTSTLAPPSQPSQTGVVGAFNIIGNSLASAQQSFLGSEQTVYIVDKVENNPTQINGHPTWASEYTLGTNSQRPMDALTNTFCAGGNVMGNGTWVNVGGNQGVTYGGLPAASQKGGGPYQDPDGRQSIRLLNPCEDSSCNWVMSPTQSAQRWYPTVETLEDGTLIIIGGCINGGYVNDASQDQPNYEFFPSLGAPITSPLLQRTLPANLFPLTWLLPSGLLLMQSNWQTVLLNYHTQVETPLDDIPDAVRTYPASAGTIMMPLTPANNWTATIMFCGGSDVQPKQWMSSDFIIPTYPASTSCVKITPDTSSSYVQDDPLPEARSMANLIALPNGKILCLNGAQLGTAGYGNNSWAIGQSYADMPALTPALYDPSAAPGSRWSRSGFSPSTVPRMYHSSATLLPDGSVFVSGSNPNADYNVAAGVKYKTEYRTEQFYPSYYNERRPQPRGLPQQLSYGGPSFDLYLDSNDLFNNIDNVNNTAVVIIRTGFSTHSMNMGQRYVQLGNTFTGFSNNNTAVLHVSQVPPNPAILVPGPAFIFVVVNGVPSVGRQVMIGSGQLGVQTTLAVSNLPTSQIVSNKTSPNPSNRTSSASHISHHWTLFSIWTIVIAIAFLGW